MNSCNNNPRTDMCTNGHVKPDSHNELYVQYAFRTILHLNVYCLILFLHPVSHKKVLQHKRSLLLFPLLLLLLLVPPDPCFLLFLLFSSSCCPYFPSSLPLPFLPLLLSYSLILVSFLLESFTLQGQIFHPYLYPPFIQLEKIRVKFSTEIIEIRIQIGPGPNGSN